ncbi:MAG: HRDC domain-containing protein [Kineosporiaceae bacterium]
MSEGVPDVAAEVEAAPAAPPLTLLDAPRDGIPPVIADPQTLAEAVAALAAGSGPVAVDAERASGHRYGQRAFLVQLRREGTGTLLVDPAALPDLSSLGEAMRDAEWILHAAGQDLPCLAEVGMRPTRLFDTELGSRLAGLARVGLAAVVEQLLGLGLAKEHSAVDWSTRPLPEPWLRYAALDVEVLIELRDALAADLEQQGKLAWAHEEFAALAAAPPPPPRVDPWRRTSGLHRLRTRRQLAALRELWTAREQLARTQDVSPGRLIPDSSLVEAALARPTSARELAALTTFTGRAARRQLPLWVDALARAAALPDAELPPQHLPADGPPPARVWSDKDPAAAARLAKARNAVQAIATAHTLPVENLISPDAVRRLCWTPPVPADADSVRDALADLGVRTWQLDLTVDALVEALG